MDLYVGYMDLNGWVSVLNGWVSVLNGWVSVLQSDKNQNLLRKPSNF